MEKTLTDNTKKIHSYVLKSSLRETEILNRLRSETHKDPAAIMQIPPEQGQFMALLVKLISAKRTIEIGVYTGYSALCVAQALPEDGYMVACDINEEWLNVAKRYWIEAGVSNKIDLRVSPAVETLESLLDDGQKETFDFIFIDADKQNYDQYYELSLKLLRPGGLVAIDNTLLFGSVVSPKLMPEKLKGILSDSDIEAVKQLNLKIKQDLRVEISMLQVADGITLVRKNDL
ncbi:class I SAM-dependent methyltransferase [Sessilibacter corallicola]|uniref:Class I SAM-dependent methyltransferase n=1 Tax=Sessilibacter corallicola TaxID=2904075 RepID=A0ABQ0AEJ6_9GAMM